MARYIDADKVMEEINRIGGHNLCEWGTIGVKALICRQETANVAPIADTVKKMQELIKERCIEGGIYPAFVARTIDQVAKEILEGK